MAESMVYSFELPVYPERVYRAWLDGGEQSRITGAAARVDARAGGQFSALDGRVSGTFKTLTPHDRIVLSWQMADFPGPDGEVELVFEPTCTGTEVKIYQSGIPTGKADDMMAWWETNFTRPIKAYFDALVGEYVADMGDG